MIPRRIILVSLAVATSLLGDTALYTVLPIHAEQLGIRIALVGILLSANRFVRLLSNSWAGHIQDRFRSSWPFVIALVVGAFITAVYGLFWGFWVFLTARLIWGVCWSFLRSEGYTCVIRESPSDSRGKLMGVYTSFITLGFMAGGFLGGVLTDAMGYRNCMLLFSCFSFLGAFAMFLEQYWGNSSKQNAISKAVNAEIIQNREKTANSQSLPDDFQKHVSPEKWLIYLMSFTNILVGGGIIGSTLGRLLKILFGMTMTFRGISIGIASVTGVLMLIRRTTTFLLAPVLGHYSDRVGRRLVLMSGFTINLIVLLCMATQQNFILISLAAIASSIAGVCVSVSLDALIADTASEDRRGRLVGRYVTFTDLGSACGPLISYLLLGVHIGIEKVYLGGLVLLIAVFAIYGLQTFYGGKR